MAGGCKTTGHGGLAPAGDTRDTRGATAPEFPRITADFAAFPTIGLAVRHIGESSGGGAVLLAGLEDLAPPRLNLSQAEFSDGLQRLVAGRDCVLQQTPYYVFIYPRGYEQQESLSLVGTLSPRFEGVRASFAVGAGTALFNAFALLSDALEITVVADNQVAEDAWCGELFLDDAPVSAIIEAILKSALLPREAIHIESTDDYVFIRSVSNPIQVPACVNCDALSPAQRRSLEARVDVQLPRVTPAPVFEDAYTPLEQVLGELSAQLGMAVSADPSLAKFPVHVAVMQDVPVGTALDLVVWQWSVPQFGYRVTGDGIYFCRR